eukprot:TRINITY_DN3784_c0_g1_i1.p1 TRINITY_DN3784_c0_g1~~TRINITY_DN3784_c0_g1_i1.p1  ORF type:complete len:203 (-),score=13.79 TRINITY_DN3784_c0_g1_i1:2-610(-)
MYPYQTNYSPAPQYGYGSYGAPTRSFSETTTLANGTQVTRTTSTFDNSWYAPYYHQMQNSQQFNNLQYWFQSVDRDRSGSISAMELAQVQFRGRPLGYPCAAKLITAFDKDNSGTIDFREYVALHGFLTTMSNAFFYADRDQSGTLDAFEIYNAVASAGFRLSQSTISAIVRRYNNTGVGLTFDSFLTVSYTHLTLPTIYSV